MHITGILYDSRAASVGIVFSIGGCVTATTTTTPVLGLLVGLYEPKFIAHWGGG